MTRSNSEAQSMSYRSNYRTAEFFCLFFFSKKFSPSCTLFFNLFTTFFWYKTTKNPLFSLKFVFFRFSINRKSFTVTLVSRFPCTAQPLFSQDFKLLKISLWIKPRYLVCPEQNIFGRASMGGFRGTLSVNSHFNVFSHCHLTENSYFNFCFCY